MEKDVGVLLTCNLKPLQQCAQAAKKARQVLGQMTRTFHYRYKHTLVTLYKTYVRCHLEDCVQAWPLYQLRDMELLKSVQRKAIRMVSGLQGIMYKEWLKECGLTTLEDGRLQGDMI